MRRRRTRRPLAGVRAERLEDRLLLSLLPNSVEDLSGQGFNAVLGAPTTTDVATFRSVDPGAVASDFVASINWGDGTSPIAGTVGEDASGIFHVSGTHTYTGAGPFTPTVTIRDANGALYQTGTFYQTNLVSSVSGNAPIQDMNLINPWGLASTNAPLSTAADEGSGLATSYNLINPTTGSGPVTIPSGRPTGLVYNILIGKLYGPPASPYDYFYATLGGTIGGWASGGPATTLATVSGAEFTGLAEAQSGPDSRDPIFPYLYATDFTGATGTNGIDVFDSSFRSVTGSGGAFAGKFADPNLPAGFEPFNIVPQYVNGTQELFVAYAKPSGTAGFTGTGGYVDVFDTGGNLIKTVVSDAAGNDLNGPWGMMIAPSNFGYFSGDLLIGNFDGGSGGDIAAADLSAGYVTGRIDGADGRAILNQGLWSLASYDAPFYPVPGGIYPTSAAGSLFISAGIDSQTQGLLGQISYAPTPSANIVSLVAASSQPTVSATAGRPFTGPVASFDITIPDPGIVVEPAVPNSLLPDYVSIPPTPGDFYGVTIDWGDGTPATPGTIAQSADDRRDFSFLVDGAHTYASPGHYTITATVHDVNGLAATFTNTAIINPASQNGGGGGSSSGGGGGSQTLTGQLNPSLAPGHFGTQTLTNDVRPDFVGTYGLPGSTIALFAMPAGAATRIFIGQGTVGAGGAWDVAANQPLADGTYSISADVGGSAGGSTTIVPALVIDTVGPTIPAGSIVRTGRTILVTFHDPVGMDVPSLDDAINYQLVEPGRPHARKYRIAVESATPGTTPGTETVKLRIRGGGRLPVRRLDLRIVAATSPTNPAGLRDLAHNPLAGGDFVERLAAIPTARAARRARR